MGSVLALESSVEIESIKAMCLWAIIADPFEVFGAGSKRTGSRRSGGEEYGVYYGLPFNYNEPGWILNRDFFDDLKNHQSLSQIQRDKPLLIVHGDSDTGVDVRN